MTWCELMQQTSLWAVSFLLQCSLLLLLLLLLSLGEVCSSCCVGVFDMLWRLLSPIGLMLSGDS